MWGELDVSAPLPAFGPGRCFRLIDSEACWIVQLVKPVIIATLLTLFLVPRLTAQIYADFSISQDGEPLGSFRVLLHHETVPRPVANFVGLATGERKWISPASGMVQDGVPYYDGLTFHRLIHNFMIQGGDPLGTGTGGPGYVFQD